MAKKKVVICKICGNETPYKTNKPTSCRDCLPFWVRAGKIMSDDRRHTAHFPNEIAFAKFIRDKFFKQKEKCKYSGIQMYKKNPEDPYPIEKEVYDLFKFSVERLDSKKNYTSSNTVICCNIYNIMKSNTELARFVELLTDLLEGLYKRSIRAIELKKDTKSNREIIHDIYDFSLFYKDYNSDKNINRTDEETEELVRKALNNEIDPTNQTEGVIAELEQKSITNLIIRKNRDRELLEKAIKGNKSEETIKFLLDNSSLSNKEIEEIVSKSFK
ncbi:hypothetical protein [Bacillus sp. Brlt_9]|uniref:hypothetical protein n=1 Tax=Bacillus sp. Brlt_9 TaxID=3110916 RepID=UPI003F7C6676